MPRDPIHLKRDKVYQKLMIWPRLSREQFDEVRPLLEALSEVDRVTMPCVIVQFDNLGLASTKLGKVEAHIQGILNSIRTSLPRPKRKKKQPNP